MNAAAMEIIVFTDFVFFGGGVGIAFLGAFARMKMCVYCLDGTKSAIERIGQIFNVWNHLEAQRTRKQLKKKKGAASASHLLHTHSWMLVLSFSDSGSGGRDLTFSQNPTAACLTESDPLSKPKAPRNKTTNAV